MREKQANCLILWCSCWSLDYGPPGVLSWVNVNPWMSPTVRRPAACMNVPVWRKSDSFESFHFVADECLFNVNGLFSFQRLKTLISFGISAFWNWYLPIIAQLHSLFLLNWAKWTNIYTCKNRYLYLEFQQSLLNGVTLISLDKFKKNESKHCSFHSPRLFCSAVVCRHCVYRLWRYLRCLMWMLMLPYISALCRTRKSTSRASWLRSWSSRCWTRMRWVLEVQQVQSELLISVVSEVRGNTWSYQSCQAVVIFYFLSPVVSSRLQSAVTRGFMYC